MNQAHAEIDTTRATTVNLQQYGIQAPQEVLHNPSFDTLFAEETKPGLKGYEAGHLTESGAITVDTGIFTGRSPRDKYLVRDDTTPRPLSGGPTRVRTTIIRSMAKFGILLKPGG